MRTQAATVAVGLDSKDESPDVGTGELGMTWSPVGHGEERGRVRLRTAGMAGMHRALGFVPGTGLDMGSLTSSSWTGTVPGNLPSSSHS